MHTPSPGDFIFSRLKHHRRNPCVSLTLCKKGMTLFSLMRKAVNRAGESAALSALGVASCSPGWGGSSYFKLSSLMGFPLSE